MAYSTLGNWTLPFSKKHMVIGSYLCLLSGLVLIFPLVLSLAIAIIYGANHDKFQNSHHHFIKRTIGYGALWVLLCAVLSYFVIGYFLFFVVWAWLWYRGIKGVIFLLRGREILNKGEKS